MHKHGGGGCGSLVQAVGVSSRAGEVLDQLAVSTVLRCAVNCSSVTRSTPLHLAAERGSAGVVSKLLAAGAVVDARDTAGSTALFLASEAGHTAVVERLLAAGSDPRLGNSAGETPLYIAALRGHLGCVKELLLYCKARGIDWQDPEMYGDSWTPLHAAAVANRADVAAYLLQVGARDDGVGAGGHSVLHVAARKGSSQLLRLLLSAGGVAVVGSRDGSGDTPVDVAKKNRHVAALAEFRRLTAGHTTTRGSQSAATAMA
ncbi:ankyrin-repeat protein [Volvox carteri f. nagariensis]|uniref:Ankyrin-repeat protein n=1 Tax=Volvox carteri f. nagariensis TaxID=3068 RepID=D8UED1_VOLCA|nr:ankyrin-repeat protein [Volvox carteri f. nagariensis]EFJ41984.1 ankyrin-repeat protein [Volvox carteri f. nagariensis]|eukprot:XP_002957021.1 ankyrin-repeat protein [Volvox carteri f. nagariensis]